MRPIRRHGLALATLVAAVAAVAGCGGREVASTPSPSTPTTAVPPAEPLASPPRPPELARCPAGLTNCETASGEILYTERVDPDGDGDAHFVLASAEGITAPGISVIDVAVDLRPRPLPLRGDLVSAAGPVYEGSYGQHQIQAVEVNVSPGRRVPP